MELYYDQILHYTPMEMHLDINEVVKAQEISRQNLDNALYLNSHRVTLFVNGSVGFCY